MLLKQAIGRETDVEDIKSALDLCRGFSCLFNVASQEDNRLECSLLFLSKVNSFMLALIGTVHCTYDTANI